MSISLAEFQKLVNESFEVDQEIDRIKSVQLKPLEKRMSELNRAIIEHLDQNELKSFKSDAGQVIRSRRSSVTVPKTPEEKKALFAHLQGQGEDVFYAYATVNSQSLNSYYKQELEKAKEEGNFDFQIPGVGEPTFTDIISRRRAKS